MSAELKLRAGSDPSASSGDLTANYLNTTNAPILSITVRQNGQMMAGTYRLVFTKVGAVVTCEVKGQGSGSQSRNPWANRTGLPVTADGSTKNQDLVPGIDVVVDSSVDTGWTGYVVVGNTIVAGPTWTEYLEMEVVSADALSSARQIAVCNIGTEEAQDCYLYSLPGSFFDGVGAETFIERLAPHTDPARHKLASVEKSQIITMTDWADDIPSGKKKCNVKIDGNTAVTGALFDGSTFYQYGVAGYDDANDYLTGYGIMLPDITDDPSSVNVTQYIRAGYQWVEWAPDVSGAPGTWQTADLAIGNLAAASYELAWVRMSIPSAVQPASLQRLAWLRPRGLSI